MPERDSGDDAATAPTTPRLADLLRNVSYEIVPLKSAEEAAVAHVPRDIPLTVTATTAKGVSATVELAERLSGHGYSVAPHLPARLVRDEAHMREIVERLQQASVDRILVIGGDAPEPLGPYPDAYSLLLALEEVEHPFIDVGIGGYPEGHAEISHESLLLALKNKAPYATHLITQMCFDAATIAGWAAEAAGNGVDVPVAVGMPGPVNRQKLMRLSAGLGLGQSARFLRKQQNTLWRFLLPGGYNPTRLVRRLGRDLSHTATYVRSIHIYTFNELAKTEQWRRTLLAWVREER